MIAGDEHERHVQAIHQVSQVLERQVTAGHDELGGADRAEIGVQPLIDLVGYGEHADHASIVRAAGRGQRMRSAHDGSALPADGQGRAVSA